MKSGIKIGKVYMNMPTKEQMEKEWWGGSWQHLLYIKKVAKIYHVNIKPIIKASKYILDKDSYIKVLYVYDGINGMSALIILYDGKNRFLLTGDLSKKIGDYIAKKSNNFLCRNLIYCKSQFSRALIKK